MGANMKGIFARIILVQLLLVSATGLAQENPKMGGTLIWGRSGEINTLDPAKGVSAESLTVIASLFEGLVRYNDDFTGLEPNLAVSWEVSEDRKEWTFHLRKGISFHDGTPFNAHAVVFSFLRQMDPNHPFYPENIGYATYVFDQVEKVEASDDYTVIISLKRPYTPFLYSLTIPAAGIVSPTAVKRWGEAFEKNPVGTGSFRFEKWGSGKQVIVGKNTDYWATPPYLDRVIYEPIKISKDRLLELMIGAIQVMDDVSPEDINRIVRDKNLRLKRIPGLNLSYLAMNTEKKPFDQLKVRKAVNHAINKTNLVKLLYQGLAIPAANPFPPTIWGYNTDVTGYEYNPQKAKTFLKEAGYPNGFQTTLWQMPVPRFYNPKPEKLAELVQANLAAVGIEARIISSHDWKTYLKKGKSGEHELAFFGWGAEYADPDYFLYNLLDKDNAVKGRASNRAFFKHDRLHELLIKAQQISDQKERILLYHEAQVIIHEQAPIVPLAHVEEFLAIRKNVRGIVLDPRGYHGFHKAWIE
jgi:peptide/nickel transport system substrate-binding protein